MKAEAPLFFFSPPPHRNFEPPFQKFMTTVHPIALQRWLKASLVSRFFFSLIPLNQRTNFCNFVTKLNKITKAVGLTGNFVYKALRALLRHHRAGQRCYGLLPLISRTQVYGALYLQNA